MKCNKVECKWNRNGWQCSNSLIKQFLINKKYKCIKERVINKDGNIKYNRETDEVVEKTDEYVVIKRRVSTEDINLYLLECWEVVCITQFLKNGKNCLEYILKNNYCN